MAKKQARALRDDNGNGVSFAIGSIVVAEAAIIKSLEAAGAVDSSKEAVAYALSEGGTTVELEVELDPAPVTESGDKKPEEPEKPEGEQPPLV